MNQILKRSKSTSMYFWKFHTSQSGTTSNKKYALRPAGLAYGKCGVAALRIFLGRYRQYRAKTEDDKMENREKVKKSSLEITQ